MRAIAPSLATVIGLGIAGCSDYPPASPTEAAVTQQPAVPFATPQPIARATTDAVARVPIGVFDPSQARSWAGIAAFGRQAGQPVSYVVTYLGAKDPFPERLGQEAAAHGAQLILQLQPSMSMARVAAGHDDAYLDGFARQIRQYGHHVIVSWAAEANGNWYYWGAPHTSARDYRAAWAHVMSRFRGTRTVTWMATINRTYPTAAATRDYVIPGVDLYGIDAYYAYRNDTFETVFGPTIAQIRAVTNKPIMASETGIGPVSGQAMSIPDLVRGVRDNHLAGMVYFNENQGTASLYHQNWALSPAALKVLRTALSVG